MKGYSQIAAIRERSRYFCCYSGPLWLVMPGLIFVLLSQIGVLVKLSAAVGLIFDSTGLLEAVFIFC